MKINLVGALILVIFLVLASAVNASEWTRNVAGDPDVMDEYEEMYTASVGGGVSCMVALRNDGDIEVFAEDPNWHGKSVVHGAVIPANSGFIRSSTRISKKEGGPYVDGGYWVFSAKCLEISKKLPADVKAKFHDAFGIN